MTPNNAPNQAVPDRPESREQQSRESAGRVPKNFTGQFFFT